MKISDIGAGIAFITVQLARRVGRRGYVIANDLQPQMLDALLERPDLSANVISVLSTAFNTNLPPNTLDLIKRN